MNANENHNDLGVSKRGLELYRVLARVVYLAAGLVILLWLLHSIERVLLASILALILAVALNAPVTWLERKEMSRSLALAISFLCVMALTAFLLWLIIPRLSREIPTLAEEIPRLIEHFTEQIVGFLGDYPGIQQQMDRILDWMIGIFEGLWRYADDVLAGLLLLIFIIALVLYMVANLREILQWYVVSMPPRLRDPAARAFARASEMVIGWIIASVILGGIKAVAATVFLLLMGIPGAMVWSVLAFFGAFIPRVGFYLITIPPVIMAFTVSPMAAIWTLVFYVAFSELLGNFVAPRIYAQTMRLNAVLILFMMLAMGYAFGIVGVLIATPVAGFVKAYYDEFFLNRQPEDPELTERIEAMVRRDAEQSARGV